MWADNIEEEEKIWGDFLSILARLEKPVLVHYGSLEKAFFRLMMERYGGLDGESPVSDTIRGSINVLSLIFAQVYFPTYSNGLKDVAKFLGFEWSEPNAAGIQTIVWRKEGERSRYPRLKKQLTTYNAEDCEALGHVTDWLREFLPRQGEKANGHPSDVVHIDSLPRWSPLKFQRNRFRLPELEEINRAAYWDYQRNLAQLIGSPGYHPLLLGRPAIDAGNPAGCSDNLGNPLNTDQRGLARPQGSACDIGAYEYVESTAAPASLGYLDGSNQRIATGMVFPKPFTVYVLDNNGSPASGVTLTFTAPASGPSGIFTDSGTNVTTALSDSGGIASSSFFTANDQPGSYIATAAVAGLADTITFALTNFIAPPNDNFSSAKTINQLPFNDSMDNTEATLENGETLNCYLSMKTVWYSYTPANNALIRADMLGSSFEDTSLAIYQATGPGIGDLIALQCADYGATATFSVQPGVTYYFQAGSIYSGGGNLNLNLREVPPPANDDFANALVIPLPLPYDTTVDTDMHLESMLARQPIAVHVVKPSTNSLLHEDDYVAHIPKLLQVAAVPATVTNWGGDAVSIEEWCTYIGQLIGVEPTFVHTDQTAASMPLDLTRMHQLIGATTVDWHDGICRMIQVRHPELTLRQ